MINSQITEAAAAIFLIFRRKIHIKIIQKKLNQKEKLVIQKNIAISNINNYLPGLVGTVSKWALIRILFVELFLPANLTAIF